MALTIVLFCIAALLGLAPLTIAIGRSPTGIRAVYGACLAISLIALAVSLGELLHVHATPLTMTLPLGLPWLGVHFRIDALSAFFLTVVNLGAAAASLFALGYGTHEKAPLRVLPFYPAFLAGMNLVVTADNAFTFLSAWEFMSLTSWALVMSHHREPGNAYAGYVYLVMATFGTLTLLLAFGMLAGPSGGYAFDAMRASHPAAAPAAIVLLLALTGAGSKAESCRCMSGCRSRIRPRQATFRP